MTADATSTQALAEQTSQTDASVPEGPPGGQGGVLMDLLGIVGVGFLAVTELEQNLTAAFGAIPFPALPALRVLDAEIGIPHGHFHPPNLIPPIIPVPLPLPSVGLILPIPWFSGAETVFLNGMPAARCGDMGVAVWCGSFFPMFEIFLGSCNVWFEGARAGRVGVDITTHCIFAAPKPQDPPCYPWIGFPVTASGDVMIGGIPLPSLTNWAIGKAFEILFSGAMAVVRRIVREIRARVAVRRFLSNVSFGNAVPGTGPASRFADVTEPIRDRISATGDDAFRNAVRDDLLKVARTDEGFRLLKQLRESGQNIDIQFSPDSRCHPVVPGYHPTGLQPGQAQFTVSAHTDKSPTHLWHGVPVTLQLDEFGVPLNKGTPVGSIVYYDPFKSVPETPSDVVLVHELNHAAGNATGTAMSGITPIGSLDNGAPIVDEDWVREWKDLEELDTVGVENAYRAERGIELRPNYGVTPGYPLLPDGDV